MKARTLPTATTATTTPLGSIPSGTCDRGSFFSNANSPPSDGDRSMILISGTHQELKGDAAATPPIFFSQFFFLHEAQRLIDDVLMTEVRSTMIGSVWFESRVTWRKQPPTPPHHGGAGATNQRAYKKAAFRFPPRGRNFKCLPGGGTWRVPSGNDPEIDGPVNQVTSQLSGFHCDRL